MASIQTEIEVSDKGATPGVQDILSGKCIMTFNGHEVNRRKAAVARYYKALEQGLSEKEAVAIADAPGPKRRCRRDQSCIIMKQDQFRTAELNTLRMEKNNGGKREVPPPPTPVPAPVRAPAATITTAASRAAKARAVFTPAPPPPPPPAKKSTQCLIRQHKQAVKSTTKELAIRVAAYRKKPGEKKSSLPLAMQRGLV